MRLFWEACHSAVVIVVCVCSVMVRLVERGLEVVVCEGGGDVQEDMCCQWLQFPPCHEWDAIGSSGRVVSVIDGVLLCVCG